MTSDPPDVRIAHGYPPALRSEAAALVWEAFAGELGRVLGPSVRGKAYLQATLDPKHALAAFGPDGTLLGVAGYKTGAGGFIGGTYADLVTGYGRLGALWRDPLLATLERAPGPDTMLMDGICVAAPWRGQGIGTRLLSAVIHQAATCGCARVRLHVTDSNPRARRLYIRQGFEATHTERFGPLRLAFGFRSATAMVRELAPGCCSAASR